MHMPGVFGEIGRKIEGWYRPICASFRKLLRESSQAARVLPYTWLKPGVNEKGSGRE